MMERIAESTRWRCYEEDKKELEKQNLPPKEYEKKLAELVKKWRL